MKNTKKSFYSLLFAAAFALAGCGGDEYHEAVWSHTFQSSSDACGAGIAIDPQGDVVVVGKYKNELNLGGEDLPYANGGGLFIAKYNSDGTHVWSKQLTDKDSHADLVIAGNGDILVTGDFYQDISLLGVELSSPRGGVFLTKLTPSGNTRWTKSFDGEDRTLVRGLGVDGEGNIVIAGSFDEAITFGPDTLVSAGSSDGFLAHFTSDGTLDWSLRAGNANSNGFSGPYVAANGDIAVKGSLTQLASDEDSYGVAQYSATGERLDAQEIETAFLLPAWTIDGNHLIFATTAVGNSPEEENTLTRVSPGGETIWTTEAIERRWRGIAVDDEDRIHFISDSRIGSDGRAVWVTTYDQDGAKLGRGKVLDSLGGAEVTAVAAGPNGRIAVTGCARDDGFFGNDDNVFVLEVEMP